MEQEQVAISGEGCRPKNLCGGGHEGGHVRFEALAMAIPGAVNGNGGLNGASGEFHRVEGARFERTVD